MERSIPDGVNHVYTRATQTDDRVALSTCAGGIQLHDESDVRDIETLQNHILEAQEFEPQTPAAIRDRMGRERPASPAGGYRVMIVLPNGRGRLNVENRMDPSKFETELCNDGFGEIVKGEMKPNEIRNVHAHDYEVRGLVLDGEIVLTCDGKERGFGVGEIFTMEAGREHAERAGSAGLRFIAGRRRQAG